ncbi:restriction endonuclease [Stenotrophomonas maltophilia]|nr:restriction endonuclease [Stenotrophomonas maltophilia]
MKKVKAKFAAERLAFHAALLNKILTLDEDGNPSNSDSASGPSKKISKHIAKQLKVETKAKRVPGQISGASFESACTDFIRSNFVSLNHIRPGNWLIKQVGGRNRRTIASFQQYAHLVALDKATKGNKELAAALGSDYTITPDIIIYQSPIGDDVINATDELVDNSIANRASIRKANGGLDLLHASISCKWTIRSDRAQNARSEALNLIRNRKGRLPHAVVVTAEPLPSRLASIALGTGDIDCTYHFALYELQRAVDELGLEEAKEMLAILVDGQRLKDISDLPLDLAI